MTRRVLVLLIASLIANVFLLGVIGGTIWHWTHDRGMGLRGGWRTRIAGSLPEPQAGALRAAIHATVEQTRPVLREGHAARAEAARLFVQPNFDAAAITTKLDQARTADMTLRTNLEHRIVTFAATLPQAQRAKMADALKEGPFPHHRPRAPDAR